MTRFYEVRADHTSCEEVYGETCKYNLGEEECKNCAIIYEGDTEEVINELEHIGLTVYDIHESEYLGGWKTWWVKVKGVIDREVEFGLEWV